MIAAVIQPDRVLRGKRTASEPFGGVLWTALLCFCNLELIRDMAGLELLRHIGLMRFMMSTAWMPSLRASITLCMRLQFPEREDRKWGDYKDEGDLLSFFSAKETRAGFKGKRLQCMSDSMWLTSGDMEYLWRKNVKCISVFFKWFSICLEAN